MKCYILYICNYISNDFAHLNSVTEPFPISLSFKNTGVTDSTAVDAPMDDAPMDDVTRAGATTVVVAGADAMMSRMSRMFTLSNPS